MCTHKCFIRVNQNILFCSFAQRFVVSVTKQFFSKFKFFLNILSGYVASSLLYGCAIIYLIIPLSLDSTLASFIELFTYYLLDDSMVLNLVFST